jgi:16S rRNA (guanine1516-N2)-methyltransferase
MPPLQLAITYTSTSTATSAQALAIELNLPLLTPAQAASHAYHALLVQTPTFLGLLLTNDLTDHPFYIDFLSSQWLYRIKLASLRKEQLAKAIGIAPKMHPILIDATAGLGRDSFILATLGYEVTLIEQSPIVYALLRDGLNRAQLSTHLKPITERMHLIYGDAKKLLPTLNADVVYLDPMFPDKKKSAAVKKEMVLLQTLLDKEDDNSLLLETALISAKKRVVVKRPRLGEMLSTHQPNFSLIGKSSRFDVYLINTESTLP